MARSVSQYRPLAAVVLAAGEGTRMRSGTPKVLHPLCGRPMVLHVVDALAELPLERIVVVVGHGAERVTKTLQDQLVTEVPVEFVEQRVQRGTGDAVSVALTLFDDLDAEDDILVLPGDAPAACAPRRSPSSRPSTASRTRPRRVLTAHVADADRPRPRRPRQGRSGRPHRRARRRRPTRSSRSTRSTRRSTASAATCSRPRCAG